MTFKSFLSAVGHAPLAVLKFLNTPTGQKVVQIAEGTAVAVGTEVGGTILGGAIARLCVLVNKGLSGVVGMEATAAQIDAQSGTGLQKGAAVAAALAPEAEELLKALGYDNPTVEQIEHVANITAKGLADIVNQIPPPAALASPATGVQGQATPAQANVINSIPQAAVAAFTTGMTAAR